MKSPKEIIETLEPQVLAYLKENQELYDELPQEWVMDIMGKIRNTSRILDNADAFAAALIVVAVACIASTYRTIEVAEAVKESNIILP